MTIYVVMIDDRHTDTDAEVFTDPDLAVRYARDAAGANARHPEDIEEEPIDEWLYYARYSVEGDSVWVVAKELRP